MFQEIIVDIICTAYHPSIEPLVSAPEPQPPLETSLDKHKKILNQIRQTGRIQILQYCVE